MDVKPLDWLLDTLAKAESHLQEEDRAACARVADALRHRCTGFSGPIRVVLVTGPDADWLTQEVEWLAEAFDEDRDRRRMIASQVETLLDELRERRKRITAERDAFRHAAQTLADSVDEVASGELGLDDIKAERLAVRALLTDPTAVTPQNDGSLR